MCLFEQVEHPQRSKKAVWHKLLSKQRKRAVVACFRMAPLYNLPRWGSPVSWISDDLWWFLILILWFSGTEPWTCSSRVMRSPGSRQKSIILRISWLRIWPYVLQRLHTTSIQNLCFPVGTFRWYRGIIEQKTVVIEQKMVKWGDTLKQNLNSESLSSSMFGLHEMRVLLELPVCLHALISAEWIQSELRF